MFLIKNYKTIQFNFLLHYAFNFIIFQAQSKLWMAYTKIFFLEFYWLLNFWLQVWFTIYTITVKYFVCISMPKIIRIKVRLFCIMKKSRISNRQKLFKNIFLKLMNNNKILLKAQKVFLYFNQYKDRFGLNIRFAYLCQESTVFSLFFPDLAFLQNYINGH